VVHGRGQGHLHDPQPRLRHQHHHRLPQARDRTLLLLLGFVAALRRSELLALEVGNLAFVPEGLRLGICRSKADQEGAGEVIGVVRTGSATCPVAALRAWCDAASITEGRLFRKIDRHGNCGTGLTDHSVALLVKKCAAQAGLDPPVYSGHSLTARCSSAMPRAASGCDPASP
jgi:site-specific recombinase XerD